MTPAPVNNDEAPESGVASTGLGLARADAALLPQTRAPQLQLSDEPRHVIAGTSHKKAQSEQSISHTRGVSTFFFFSLFIAGWRRVS